jgi:hypothetical protein
MLSDFVEECSHVPLMCDSTSDISVAKNPMLHSKTKHIEVRYHFLRDNVEKGNIDLILRKVACRYPNEALGPRYICMFARRAWSRFAFFKLWLGGLMYISCLHVCIFVS